jgi:hypothetical protein
MQAMRVTDGDRLMKELGIEQPSKGPRVSFAIRLAHGNRAARDLIQGF